MLIKMTFHFQFGFNMFPEIVRPFNNHYRCFSVSMLPGTYRRDVERGGKSTYTHKIYYNLCTNNK